MALIMAINYGILATLAMLLSALVYFAWRKDLAACIILLAALLPLGYARLVEPGTIAIRQYYVDTGESGRASELRIAVFSDLHVGAFKDPDSLAELVEKVNAARPDLILIPGDFVYSMDRSRITSGLAALGAIKAPAYAVTGNHDEGKPGKNVSAEVKAALSGCGIAVIDNESLVLEIKGRKIRLVGFSDIYGGSPEFELLEKVSSDELAIALAHNPDSVYYFSTTTPDLVISGHTHGGQVRIPGIYRLAIPSRFGFDRGWYDARGMRVFVSPGIGMVGLPLRFLSPPEIDMITLR